MHSTDSRPIKVRPEGAPMPPEPNAYSAVLGVGEFVGFVVSWLDAVPSVSGVSRFSEALAPIWPLPEGGTFWPPRLALDYAGLDELADAIVSSQIVQSGEGRPNI